LIGSFRTNLFSPRELASFLFVKFVKQLNTYIPRVLFILI